MPTVRSFAFGLLLMAPAFALYAAGDSRHEVTSGNKWSIDNAGCEIGASWDGGVRVVVRPNYGSPGEHEIAVHKPAFTKFVPGETVTVYFGAPEDAIGQNQYSARGYREGKSSFYVSNAFDEILDALTMTNSFRFYRDDKLELELDFTGFAEALAAMRSCEASGGLDDPEKM